MLGVTAGSLTLVGLGYAAALRGGYVVDTATAQGIAQQEVQVEEKQRLIFIRQTKFDRLKLLNAVEAPSPDVRFEMELLREEIHGINDRLKELPP